MNDRITGILQKYAQIIYNSYKDKISGYGLANTITYNVIENDSTYEVVLNLEEYWKYIENGRKPGTFPNVDAITKWIRRKNIIPREYRLQNGRTVLPTEKQLSFLIGRSIKEKGIEPRPYLQESVDSIVNDMVAELETVISEYILTTIFRAF